MTSYTKRHLKPAEAPEELRQALLCMAEQICQQSGLEFNENHYKITPGNVEGSFRVGITDFAMFKTIQPHRRGGQFHAEIPVLTERGQICYAVSAFESPSVFILAVSR